LSHKISTIVIDDDPIGRLLLRSLISQHTSLTFLDEAGNAASAREKILALRPDAIFLDVHMPGATGLELLRSLDTKPFVVFVTLSENHALRAIDFDPVDYLVKPVNPERFAATVARLEGRVHAARALALVRESQPTLSLKIGSETRLVAHPDIVALQAEGNYTRVFLRDEAPVLVSTSIGRYDDALPSPPFLRLDRSLIVNRDHLTKWDRLSKDHGHLRLRGVETLFDLGRTAMERLRTAGKDQADG